MASKPPKHQIDLRRGWPNQNLLPIDDVRVATATVLSNPSIAIPGLLYGPDLGYAPLREEIAKWLTGFYAPSSPIAANRICISGGASQNLACVLQTFSDPLYTTNIWMVAPTYHLACQIFEDAGFAGKLRAVPEDEEGVDMDFLREEIRKSEAAVSSTQDNRPVRKDSYNTGYPLSVFSNLFKNFIYLKVREP
jgi:DNA-binding transcriptional MocR family regulator